MDPNFNYYQDDMNGLGFNPESDPVDPGLDACMYGTPGPEAMFMGPGSAFSMQEQAQANYNDFTPHPMTGGFHQDKGYPHMMTPDNSPHHVDQYENTAYHGVNHYEPERMPEQEQEEDSEFSPIPPPQDWRTLLPSHVPSRTQAPTYTIPQIHELHTAYTASLSSPTISNSIRMCHAKAFVFALLNHYYPSSSGYSVQPTCPGPIAACGLSSILAASDGSDMYTEPPELKTKRWRRRAGPSKQELELGELAKKDQEYNHGMFYTTNLTFDFIPPEDIAAFMVLKNVSGGNGHPDWKIHTFLTLLIDTFDLPPRLSQANFTHRSDVLADALCRGGEVQQGYGMLLYGPLVEFYAFHAGAEWVYHVDEDVEQDIEPKMDALADLNLDLRTSGLDVVDGVFKHISAREVKYKE